MRVIATITVVWAILLLQTIDAVMSNDSTETVSSESTESIESTEFSSTAQQNKVNVVTDQTQLKTLIQLQPDIFETTTPLIEIKVNEQSGVLKRTIQNIRQKYKKIDVVFLLDASSSVGKRSFLSELKFVRKFLSDFNVSYNYTRVSLVTFSSQGKIYRHVDHISEASEHNEKCKLLHDELPKINFTGGGTFTAGALKEAQNILSKARRHSKKMICLITDGFSNGQNPLPIAEKLKSDNVTIITFGIQTGNSGELHNISSDPRNEHSFLLDSFSQFESLARKALHTDYRMGNSMRLKNRTFCDELCEHPIANETSSCCDANADCTCSTISGHYSCVCKPGYYGSGFLDSCQLCPNSTYWHTWNLCKPCQDVNHIIINTPATNSSFCVCKAGFRANEHNRCEILQCPLLQPPENGYFVKHPNGCSNVLNAACGARCKSGYQLTGSSIRLCQEDGKWSGNEAKCVLKTCPRLSIPYYGMATCANEDLNLFFDYSPRNVTFMESYNNKDLRITEPMPIDTDCSFKCGPGFAMTGSSMRNCLPLSKWDGIQSGCKQILCSALPSVNFGQYDPTDCTNQKMSHGTNCTLVCDVGFEVKGPSSKICGGKRTGIWSSRNKQPKCVDVQPPELICPEGFTVAMGDDSDYALVKIFPPPNVTDNSNSDDEITFWIKPAVKDDGAKLPMGDHIFYYVAIDAFKNKAKCNFTITVLDITPPIMENCVNPPEIYIPTTPTASPNRTFVDWDPPIIYDNSNTEVNVTQSLLAGHLGVGVHRVTYHAVDLGGNENNCVMNVTVLPLQCNQLPSPANGQSLCARNATHTWCELTCEFGHTMYSNETADEHADTLKLFCDHDVAKWPIEAVVDCTKIELPNTIEQVFSITLEDSVISSCNDSKAAAEFQIEMETRLREQICPDSPHCEIVSDLPECSAFEANQNAGGDSISNRTFYHVVNRRDTVKRTPVMKVRVYTRISKKLGLWDANLPRSENIRRVKDELRTYDRNEELRQTLLTLKINVKHLNLDEVPLCRNGTVLKKSVCVQCPRGTFHIRAANACHWCPLGAFNDKVGQMECISCPRHYSTRKIGAISMDECTAQCPPGTTARLKTRPNQRLQNSLMPFCRKCLPGQYQPQYDQLRCSRCPPHHTSSRGSITSDSCRLEPRPVCHTNPSVCGPHGFCEQVRGNIYLYNCLCEEDFIGSHCERQLDLCASQPCYNGGKCSQISSSTIVCQCAERFNGQFCETEIDSCSLRSNCMNGGTCIETSDRKAICECSTGWIGEFCEIRQNFCANKPCENGQCVSTAEGFLCLCPPGIIGRRCHLRPCDYFPCHKSAQCIDERVSPATRDSYRCQCPLGRKGYDCSQIDSPCDYDPCRNNGICVPDNTADGVEKSLYEKYICKCPPYFYGKNCEIFTTPDFVMEFTKPGIHNYVTLRGPTENLRAISFCTWIQTNDTLNYGTILSYATESSDNMLTLTDYNGFVLYVNGRNVITDITLNDGEWHFVCVNWQSERGKYEIFIDGRLTDSGLNLSAGEVIEANGTLIVGQEQDSLGTSFSESESFVGRISYLDVWNRTISFSEMIEFYTTCEPYQGNLYAWTDFRHNIEGVVKITTSPFCKQCPTTLHVANGYMRYLSNRAHYHCYDGYRLQGPNVRNCLRTSQWSLPVPYCRSIKCGYLPNLSNGQFHTEKSIHGEIARYTCTENYRLVGEKTRLCRANGTWSGTHPECISLIQCNRVDAPLNGYIIYANERGRIEGDQAKYPMGTFVEVRCENNTALSGEGFLSCTESGSWDFSMPDCVEITTTPAPTTSTTKPTQAPKTSTTKPTQAPTKKTNMTTRVTTKKPNTTSRATTKKPTTRPKIPTKKPTFRTTTKKPVKTTTSTPPKTSTVRSKTSATPEPVTTTNSITTEPPLLLRETGTDPDKTFWQNWKSLLYIGCENTNSTRSPFCDQIENSDDYSNLTLFELPETTEYQHMDTKLLRHLTQARKALESATIRSTVKVDNLLQLILYGDRYSDPPSKLSKTMENSIRIVLCLYIDTILLDKNFKPDVTMLDSGDITQKLKNSLWQVASFAHQNYRTQRKTVTVPATTVASSNSPRNHRSTANSVTDIEFSGMGSHKIRRVVVTTEENETTSGAAITETTTAKIGSYTQTTIASRLDVLAENKDLPLIETTSVVAIKTLAPNPKRNTCDLHSLANPPENSSFFKMVSRDGTTTEDVAAVTEVSIGSKLLFQCHEGFEMIEAAEVAATECKEDLTWSNLTFECKAVTCDKPFHVNDMMFNTKTRTSEKYTFGHKLQLKCNDGFELNGDAFIHCTANGKWSKVQSICSKIQCDEAILPANAKFLFGQVHARQYRDTVVVQCVNKTFTTITCDATGKWIPSVIC